MQLENHHIVERQRKQNRMKTGERKEGGKGREERGRQRWRRTSKKIMINTNNKKTIKNSLEV